ncbi:ribonuclease H-like YkuK family protein [Serpentinicella alkaliphila]|nr:ribonuclease H-like YkuK family protein [Serpentinicella alkaliphila]
MLITLEVHIDIGKTGKIRYLIDEIKDLVTSI